MNQRNLFIAMTAFMVFLTAYTIQAQQAAKTMDILRVRRIELVDEREQLRGEIMCRDGGVFVNLLGLDSKARATMQVQPDDTPGISLTSPTDGTPVIVLHASANGISRMSVGDMARGGGTMIMSSQQAANLLVVTGKNGNEKVKLVGGDEGYLSISDQQQVEVIHLPERKPRPGPGA